MNKNRRIKQLWNTKDVIEVSISRATADLLKAAEAVEMRKSSAYHKFDRDKFISDAIKVGIFELFTDDEIQTRRKVGMSWATIPPPMSVNHKELSCEHRTQNND